MDENDDPKPGLTGGGGSSSSRRLDASSGVPCKYLLSCSQALEEFDFLLVSGVIHLIILSLLTSCFLDGSPSISSLRN